MNKKDWLKLLPTNYNGHNLRKLALENYDENFCKKEDAIDAGDALAKSFDWQKTNKKSGQGYFFWDRIAIGINSGTIKLSKPKVAKKQSGSESKLQQECVKWFRLQYQNVLIFAIPNGGKRNVVTAAILKAEGQLAGVPDLFIAKPSIIHHGLFIEMKFGKNKPTQQQLQVMNQLTKNGYKCAVCYSFDEFVNTVQNYFNLAP